MSATLQWSSSERAQWKDYFQCQTCSLPGYLDCTQTCTQQGEPALQILFSVLGPSLQTDIEELLNVQRKEMVKGLEEMCDEEQLRDLQLFSL